MGTNGGEARFQLAAFLRPANYVDYRSLGGKRPISQNDHAPARLRRSPPPKSPSLQSLDAAGCATDVSEQQNQRATGAVSRESAGRRGGGLIYVEADLARRPTPQIVADGVALYRPFQPDAFACEANQFQELLAAQFEDRIPPPGPLERPPVVAEQPGEQAGADSPSRAAPGRPPVPLQGRLARHAPLARPAQTVPVVRS